MRNHTKFACPRPARQAQRFETAIAFCGWATWFAVQALDNAGLVLGSSSPAHA